jgi:hypothetical protein
MKIWMISDGNNRYRYFRAWRNIVSLVINTMGVSNMKRSLAVMLLLAVMGCMHSTLYAAELLDVKPVAVPEPVSKNESSAGVAAPAAAPAPTAPTAPAPAPTAPTAPAAPAATPPTAARTVKLEPVVPIETAPVRSSALTIQEIITGPKYIEIRANQAVPGYKALKLTSPDRLVIDIASNKTEQKPKTIAINKFGISKVRVGVTPTNIRIVIDSSKAGFPVHSITETEKGLRINLL